MQTLQLIKQLQTEVLKNTKILCMTKSNTLAKFAAIKQLQTEVLKNTKSLCIMESNTLAKFAAISNYKWKS